MTMLLWSPVWKFSGIVKYMYKVSKPQPSWAIGMKVLILLVSIMAEQVAWFSFIPLSPGEKEGSTFPSLTVL